MYMRILSFFSALVLCAGISLGSLSFSPKSFAVGDYEFPFSESDIPSLGSEYPSYFSHAGYYHRDSDAYYYFRVIGFTDPSFIFNNYSYAFITRGSINSGTSRTIELTWRSDTKEWSTYVHSGGYSCYYSSNDIGAPFPYYSSVTLSNVPTGSFSYSFASTPISDIPRYWDYMPFWFPELPYGYFDGHINSLDGSFNLDFPSNTISGTSTQSGFDTYSLSLPNSSSSGEFNFNDTTGIGGGWFNTTTGSGTISQTALSTDNISLNVSDTPVFYQPSFNETSRFRTWAVVSSTSYCYFICDTRNTITGFLESVSNDMGTLRFQAVGSDSVHYPFYAIEFNFDGTKINTLSALANGFTVDFKGGTLEQDQDTGVWSCDPLYHGFWLSDGCPSVNLGSLSNKSFKWLANPIFGEAALTLNFLYSINESINNLNQSVTSSISNQTSTFQNMDSPSNFDPTDVNNMLEYGSLESDFQAPSTDDIFSVDSGTFTDGMGFWRDRMNELLFFSGSPALPMTIFSLTLGLAVLIIGRRVSGGGAA